MKNELPRHRLESDHYLLRWLRARDLDVEKAALMLRNSLKWRQEKGVDAVLQLPISQEWSQVINGTFGGIDKVGRPVIILPGGEWDLRKTFDEGRKDEVVQFATQLLEILDVTMETLWKYKFPFESLYPHTKFTIVFDLKHFSYAKAVHKKSVEALLEVVKLYEANYPETLGRCLIVNSPRVFSILFAMIKPFLSENTANKISIHDSNETNWKKQILEVVDADQLPVKYGGTINTYDCSF